LFNAVKTKNSFVKAFLEHARDLEPVASKSTRWSLHAWQILHRTADDMDMDCWCTAVEHNERKRQTREWLWDLTWYKNGGTKNFVQPDVIIEHENLHDDDRFLDDLWKVLCGFSSLRVMVGYTQKSDDALRRRLEKINEAVRDWEFPDATADLIILRRYASSAWEILERNPGSKLFELLRG
jgi:hypothetical protein